MAFVALPFTMALGAAVGLVVGTYANPDVRDQEQVRNQAEHDFAARFGALPGLVWSAYWWPLAKLIPHRSYLSHLPGLATLIAFAWLVLPTLLMQYAIIAVFIDASLIDWLTFVLANKFVAGVLLGWALQDLAHLFDDDFKFHWKGIGNE